MEDSKVNDKAVAQLHSKGQEAYATIFLPTAQKTFTGGFSPGETIYGCLKAVAHMYHFFTPGTSEQRIKAFTEIAAEMMARVEEVAPKQTVQ